MKPQDRELLGLLRPGKGYILYPPFEEIWTLMGPGQSVRRVTREARRLLEGGYIEPRYLQEKITDYVPTQKGREAAV